MIRAGRSVERAADASYQRWFRLIGLVIGLLLLAGAVITVIRRGQGLAPALDSIRDAHPLVILSAVGLPLASLALTALTFWILTRRYGQVGLGEMHALIGAAWLLNYLPFWPGMIGRIAYHRTVNRIPVTSSAAVLVWANLLNVLAAAATGSVVLLASLFLDGNDWRLALVAAAPVPVLLAVSIRAGRRADLPDPNVWRIIAVLAVRIIEMHIWAARYAVCFMLIGSPIAWGAALALACATQLASVIPIGGNALGWREWVTGLVAPLLPVGLVLGSSITLHTGLTADLVNRAAEVALAVPVGLVCVAWIIRHRRSAE